MLLIGTLIFTAVGGIAAVVLLKRGFAPPPHDPSAPMPCEDEAGREPNEPHGSVSPDEPH